VRILKAVVILMGVVIIVGTGVLFWKMYNLSSKPASAPASTPAATARAPMAASAGVAGAASGFAPVADFGTVSLGLPEGCEIAEASIGGGRLVIRTTCGEVRLLDPATGAPRGRVTR
jgi:hypothetical protein